MELRIEAVVERYSNMVLQIAFQNCFNKSNSEDITQEVFIKLISNAEKISNEEHLKAWLIRTTINLSKDYNKSFWRRNVTTLEEDIMYFDDEIQEISNILQKLKPVYRNVIYLYFYQGYKIREIATILKMNENTVSSSITRAKKQLKEFLIEGGEANA